MKSSGVKADAGDFDAGKPGAGKEADRKYLWVWCGVVPRRR